ncbi:MAG: ABC transporter ATP-binding protein [bacterium JZ-2024 1]
MFSLVRPHIPLLFVIILIGGIAQTLSSASAFLMLNPFMEEVLKKGNISLVVPIISKFLLFTFLASLCLFLHHYLSQLMGNRIGRDLHTAIYEKLLRLPIQYFKKEKSGEWLSRVTIDLENFVDFFRAPLQDLIVLPVSILIALGIGIWMNWKITVLTAIVFPLLGLALARLAERLRRATRRTRSHLSTQISAYQETLTHMPLLHLYNLEHFSRTQFLEKNWNAFRARMKEALVRAGETPLAQMIGGLAMAVVMFVAMKEISVHKVSASSRFSEGALISLLFILVNQVIRPLRRLNSAVLQQQSSLVLAARLQEMLSLQEIEQKKTEGLAPRLSAPTITWKNVSFSYDDSTYVLKDINLTAPGGKFLAIVGPSGAGKTTLINLLLGFYTPQKGEILIDGIPLEQYSLSALRSQIGVVPQQSPLFHTTIAENIRLGKLDASLQEVQEAAKKAYAHEFICKLPQGYDTDVGERGDLLSGGQKQRISIARALLREPAILILDEAAAELDSLAEAEIRKVLVESFPNCTKIVIAHRLSTAAQADYIAVLEEGKLLQFGPHQEIIQQEGLYKKLWELQRGV